MRVEGQRVFGKVEITGSTLPEIEAEGRLEGSRLSFGGLGAAARFQASVQVDGDAMTGAVEESGQNEVTLRRRK